MSQFFRGAKGRPEFVFPSVFSARATLFPYSRERIQNTKQTETARHIGNNHPSQRRGLALSCFPNDGAGWRGRRMICILLGETIAESHFYPASIGDASMRALFFFYCRPHFSRADISVAEWLFPFAVFLRNSIVAPAANHGALRIGRHGRRKKKKNVQVWRNDGRPHEEALLCVLPKDEPQLNLTNAKELICLPHELSLQHVEQS